MLDVRSHLFQSCLHLIDVHCTKFVVPHSGRPDETMLDQLQQDLKNMENKFISKIDCQHRQLSYRDQMTGSSCQPQG